ncbi:MAG: penicillin-binding protein 2, partial [Patescibacteria group bacterium]
MHGGGLRKHTTGNGRRLRMFRFFFLFFGSAIILRLAALQIVDASYYRAIAEGQHALYQELVPRRGSLFVQDFGDATWYPVATTEPRALLYADPREVIDPIGVGRAIASIVQMDGLDEYDRLTAAAQLRGAGRIQEAEALEMLVITDRTDGETDEERIITDGVEEDPDDRKGLEIPSLDANPVAKLIARLSKKDDPYEPVAQGVTEEQLRLVEALAPKGIYSVLENARSYPEPAFGGQVIGFFGQDAEGNPHGNYGLEGYFDDFLSGTPGSLYAQADVAGSWVGVGDREFTPAVDGGSLYLTIDRILKIMVCDKLAKTVEENDADSGVVVILEPATGRVLAMCGVPDFLPDDYGNEEDLSVYANQAIFTPYEPGSIFKPITMAAGIDTGSVTPNSTYTDTGSIDVGWTRPIYNAAQKIFGTVTMIEALEESVNTAMVWVMRQTGQDQLKAYIEKFGFGTLTGIELNTEAPGTIASLESNAEVYFATAAYGQGITTTPLQIAGAYATLANGGQYMKPYIVERKEYSDGTVEDIAPTFLRQVITPETAGKIAGMLVAVVEYGHGKRAAVPGYYIAGKTGTAQIAVNGVYSETAFNGSFAGFGPVEDPQFAMVVKIENPKAGVIYADSTAAPLFGEIADFLLTYY